MHLVGLSLKWWAERAESEVGMEGAVMQHHPTAVS